MKVNWSRFFIVLLLSYPVPLAAHPHVFVDSHIEFAFDTKGLAGISVQWTFDEMFSAGIIFDYDDGDGIFSSRETVLIKKECFSNLKEYGFFFDILIDGKPFPVVFVRDFSAEVVGSFLVYRFFVPCHVLATAHPKTMRVKVVDDSNFVAVTTRRSDVLSAGEDTPWQTGLEFTPATEFELLLYPDAIDHLVLQFWKP